MSGGVGEALGEAMQSAGEGLPDRDQVVQAALFEDLSEADTGALDAPSPLSAAITTRPKKGGRPPGARNRRTEAVAAWLLSQHRHPLAVMAEAYSMATIELAGRIGLRPVLVSAEGQPEEWAYENGELVELFKLQMRMAEAVAPYLAQKQPQAVQLDTQGSVQITLGGVNLPARGAAGQLVDVTPDDMKVRLPSFKSDG